jgi:hypothetical protein
LDRACIEPTAGGRVGVVDAVGLRVEQATRWGTGCGLSR